MTYYKYDSHTQAAEQRFAKKYDITPTCWAWTGYRDADGYGQFTLNFLGKKYMLRAHRYSWIIANKQDWPADMPVARHLCNNPSCVNPAHVIPGTYHENTMDSIHAGTYVNATKKRVSVPIGVFDSCRAAAAALGIRTPHLTKLLQAKTPGYAYI